MHALTFTPRVWLCLLIALVPLPGLLGQAVELEVAGSYADEGTLVSTDPSLFTGEVSLHALLRVEFDQRLVATRREQTKEVRLSRSNTLLEAAAFDHDGELAWKTQWTVTVGVSGQAHAVMLRIQSPHVTGEEYLLIMEPVSSELLQIRVQRLEATLFGPMVRASGTYVFSRVR